MDEVFPFPGRGEHTHCRTNKNFRWRCRCDVNSREGTKGLEEEHLQSVVPEGSLDTGGGTTRAKAWRQK